MKPSMRTHKRLRLVILGVLTIVLPLLAQLALAQTGFVVDEFSAISQALTVTSSSPTASNAGGDSEGTILGGERDAVLNFASGGAAIELHINDYGVDQLIYAASPLAKGTAEIAWDGNDNDATGLDYTGLNGADLTDGGTKDGFHIRVVEADKDFDLELTVYTNSSDYSEYTVAETDNINEPGKSYFVRFGDFTDVGNGASWNNVGAVVLFIDGDKETGLDLVIEFTETNSRDFGDLPSSYNNTDMADDGARHILGDLYLGTVIDGESDGQESGDADGDDTLDSSDDEDGVVRTPGVNWEPGTVGEGKGGSVDVTVTGCSGTCYLSAWIDWDNNSDFADGGDKILADRAVTNGSNTDITFDIPDGTTVEGNSFYARFRLYPSSTGGSASPTGEVYNGEVEDYRWSFDPTAVTLTRLDATSVPSRSPVGVAAAALAFVTCSAAVGGVLMRRWRAR
ncbi:MAG: GEVED domain-containing protein [Anaerolineae bacterium]